MGLVYNLCPLRRSAWIGALPGAGPLDDWLFSQGIACAAGDTVYVDYWYRSAHDVEVAIESLEVKAGLANTAAE